jgi:hypothetical protein
MSAKLGTFALWQPTYAAHRIVTFPLHGDKVPAIKGYGRVGRRGSQQLAFKFADAPALGFLCGRRNGVTVLDCDSTDERVLAGGIARHGATPLVVRTATGKFHAYYRHNGERRRIRPWRGLPIDVLGGGLVVAPPSRTPNGQYEIIQGSLDDLDRLPVMRGLEPSRYATSPAAQAVQNPAAQAVQKPFAVEEGERNNTLFRACLRHAIQVESAQQLTEFAMETNAQFVPPLSDAEAMGCALNAWNYHDRGRNFCTSQSYHLPAHAFDKLDKADGGDALLLLFRIERAHWARDQFVLSKAFAASLGWTVKRFLKARAMLIEAGLIVQIRKGGRFRGDATLFAWPTRR